MEYLNIDYIKIVAYSTNGTKTIKEIEDRNIIELILKIIT